MRLRLVLAFVLVALVSIASFGLIARFTTANEVRRFMFRGGMTGTEGLVESLEDYYRSQGNWQGVQTLLQSPMGVGGRGQGGGQGMMHGSTEMMNQRLRLADADGSIIVDTEDPNPVGELNAGDLDQSIALRVDGATVGYLLAEGGVGFSPLQQSNLVARLNRAALSASLIAGGLSLLLAFVLAYTLLRPISELTQAARKLAQGDLTQRVRAQGEDELAVLGSTFNDMAASLQQVETSRRAMTADIAHELRNPLAVQRANLEALQDGVYPLERESLEPILAQNQLLARLVDDLHTLAMADAGQLALELAEVDLKELIRRVVNRITPQADSRLVEIKLELQETCPALQVDPGRIEQILVNLLSNALRYVPESGRIILALTCEGRQARLSVEDNGPGIPKESLPLIFERFYRVDRARARAEGGSGLGLAIARQLARAHGGDLAASNNPTGGAVFILTLPIQAMANHQQVEHV